MSTHLDAHRPEFARVIEHFQRDLTSLRTGRASDDPDVSSDNPWTAPAEPADHTIGGS